MNRLAAETSPYLLQHAHNPVDWYPWGDDAFARARDTDRPILLSVGYAACHWCHVMERESFEDVETARLMNDLFVSVKVDREERPDVDAIYMQAVQALTGHGGWPMTVFLTPDGDPFYGGTYFPPEDRHGMPSFRRILLAVADAWRARRAQVADTAASLRRMYADAEAAARAGSATAGAMGAMGARTLDAAAAAIAQRYDAQHGGFVGAPKFPQSMAYDFLMRRWARTGDGTLLDQALTTFRRMARGGMYDQVGGGFHRYSVDAQWLVPHFEKMLYDNALLVSLGVRLWQATGDAEVARVVGETLAWALREMEAPTGGFYSTLDADSEGHEGKFYVWDEAELDAALGADAPLVKAAWGITPGGNFEGRNIPHVAEDPAAVAARLGVSADALDAALVRARRTLYDVRARRPWPARDEKILAGWNGLMLRAVAEAARALDRDDWRALAVRTGEFLARVMIDPETSRVMRVHKDGVTRIPGFLEDHAAVGLAFLALHETTFERRWLDLARRVGDATVRWFWDDEARAFYDTASDAERLLTRPREPTDNAVPSGTSLAAELQLRLAELFAHADARRRADAVLATWAEPMARYAPAFGHLLGVGDAAVHGFVELAIVGEPAADDFRALARAAGGVHVPALALVGGRPEETDGLPLLAGRGALDGRATAYVCRGYACDAPTASPTELAAQLRTAVRAP